ncbi:MAG: hypothetical protein Fues2KO_48380 [Fuerstiella sp.]
MKPADCLPDYRQITTCTESYFDRLGDSPLGMGWPNHADAVRRYNVVLDVIRETDGPIRLLDLGCGTGHLYEHLQQQQRQRSTIEYYGIDLSERFIHTARNKHPQACFVCGDVLQDPSLLPEYDYAVINGVFTSKVQMSFEQMFDFVKRLLKLTFRKARRGIAFNAMSKQVDWERDDLFHLPLDAIAEFACRELSRHFVLRNDYGLYEFTTYVYHDAV